MTLKEWAFVATLCGLYVVGRLRRALRRSLRRAACAGLTALLLAWLGRQVRDAWRAWRTRPAPRPPVLQGDAMWRVCPLSHWASSGCDPACCRWCGHRLPADETRFCSVGCADIALDNHVFDRARLTRRRMDGYRCVRCGSDRKLQVNHIVPVLGQHKVPGCHHHLAGLETLCSGRGSCHQATTNEQRRSGAFRRRAA